MSISDLTGRDPLHYLLRPRGDELALFPKVPVIKLLLENGAHWDAKSGRGESPHELMQLIRKRDDKMNTVITNREISLVYFSIRLFKMSLCPSSTPRKCNVKSCFFVKEHIEIS